VLPNPRPHRLRPSAWDQRNCAAKDPSISNHALVRPDAGATTVPLYFSRRASVFQERSLFHPDPWSIRNVSEMAPPAPSPGLSPPSHRNVAFLACAVTRRTPGADIVSRNLRLIDVLAYRVVGKTRRGSSTCSEFSNLKSWVRPSNRALMHPRTSQFQINDLSTTCLPNIRAFYAMLSTLVADPAT
jgi:hypothetical protein